MSDVKHLEYCVRLGNTILQNKLEQIQQGTYIENNPKVNVNYNAQNYVEDNFRDRIKNWK